MAKLGPDVEIAEPKRKREFGQWKDRIWVDPSFYEPRSDEELEDWNQPLEALASLAPARRKSAG